MSKGEYSIAAYVSLFRGKVCQEVLECLDMLHLIFFFYKLKNIEEAE
jgi:hypothetical protein